jgi:hypothetical protein
VVLLGAVMTFISVKSGYAACKPGMDTLFLNAFINLLLFTVCGAGLYLRHMKEAHKRLMTLSMVAVILPALARLPYAMSYMGWLVIGFSVVGIVHDVIVFRRIHLANVLREEAKPDWIVSVRPRSPQVALTRSPQENLAVYILIAPLQDGCRG